MRDVSRTQAGTIGVDNALGDFSINYFITDSAFDDYDLCLERLDADFVEQRWLRPPNGILGKHNPQIVDAQANNHADHESKSFSVVFPAKKLLDSCQIFPKPI